MDYMVGCWVIWWHVSLHDRVLDYMVECWVKWCDVGLHCEVLRLHGVMLGYIVEVLGYIVGI